MNLIKIGKSIKSEIAYVRKAVKYLENPMEDNNRKRQIK